MTTPDRWPWPDDLDALEAAPDSHRLILENESVRVVEILIEPGRKEPAHTHRWPSVMLVHEPARIRYYREDGALEFESPVAGDGTSPRVEWLEPESPHSVENIDEVPYRAIRVELKGS